MSDRLKANELNEKLLDLYKGQWENLEKILEGNSQLSYPQFLYVPDGYTEAKFRLMIVGKQPNEWGFIRKEEKRKYFGSNPNEIIRALIIEAEKFTCGTTGNNTLFWRASHRLNELLNPNLRRYTFLWSNLIKIDKRNHRPDPDIEKELCELRLLQEEIRITEPNVVVFFTGPDYDSRIRQDFTGEKSDWNREFATLRQRELLPPNSFRTYHPGYPRWKRRWEVIREIADSVKKPT